MARYHIKFRNINKRTLLITKDLFESGPWTGTDEEKMTKFETWLRKVSAVYSVPTPSLEIDQSPQVSTRGEGYEAGQITLPGFSVTTLFHLYRHHLQFMGSVAAEPDDCEDAQAWSCSLFYSVRPRMYRRRVREGRIIGVTAEDLLSSATLERRLTEMYDGDRPDLDSVLDVDTLTGSHDSTRPDEDEEVEVAVQVVDRSPVEIVNTSWIIETYGVSRSFVSIHAERMGGRKADSRWYFERPSVEAYMAERTAHSE